MSYACMDDAALKQEVARLEQEAHRLRSLSLSLDMTRGKPCPDQIDLSKPMFDVLSSSSSLYDAGVDAGNYGCLEGLASARPLFAEMLDVPISKVYVGDSSSLNIMFDVVAHCFVRGLRGNEPWCKLQAKSNQATSEQATSKQQDNTQANNKQIIKFLCPSPGYDRHFGLTAHFGIENIAVPMNEDGPNMDLVQELVENDPMVKGIWCVPKYQNPMGITFSDEVVRRFAALKPAAPDFRIYWDNAYAVHDLSDTPDSLLNIFDAMDEAGSSDLVFEFASTSKITFPGSGIACIAASEADLADIMVSFSFERVSSNKVEQLMHARYLPNMQAVTKHMQRHAEFVRPRFELVEQKLTEGLAGLEGVSWTHPNGGYFVSFDGPEGTAKAVVALAAELGVKMTAAGATWPYGHDPYDTNIRIAPTFPSVDELAQALDVFVVCVRLVCAKRELKRRAS